MASGRGGPLVYLDTNVYVKAFKEPAEQWRESARAILTAVEVGDIRVAASTFTLVELTVIRGGRERDRSRARAIRTELVDEFLPKVGVLLGELDTITTTLAREINEMHPKLRGADLVHMATAVRLGCGHLFTFNTRDFPMGQTVNGVLVSLPRQVWDARLDDEAVDWPTESNT